MEYYEEKLEEICRMYGVEKMHLLSRRREKHLMEARKVAYWVLRNCGLSFTEIGKLMNKSHTTVLKVLRGIKNN